MGADLCIALRSLRLFQSQWTCPSKLSTNIAVGYSVPEAIFARFFCGTSVFLSIQTCIFSIVDASPRGVTTAGPSKRLLAMHRRPI